MYVCTSTPNIVDARKQGEIFQERHATCGVICCDLLYMTRPMHVCEYRRNTQAWVLYDCVQIQNRIVEVAHGLTGRGNGRRVSEIEGKRHTDWEDGDSILESRAGGREIEGKQDHIECAPAPGQNGETNACVKKI